MHNELVIPDSHEITVGKFKLLKTALVITGEPSFDEWDNMGELLSRADGAVHWWIGDWLRYGEKKYGETYAQAMDETRFNYQTLRNDQWVASALELSRRRDNLSWGHHAEVAKFEPDEQDYWLDAAEQNEWTRAELRKQIRAALVSEQTPELPPGQYEVMYADPPWQFDNSGFAQSAASIYPTMSTDQIGLLPIKEKANPENCVLFLWATNAMLPDAMQVMAAWGFDYKTNIVWCKDAAPGMGWFTKSKHELLLIGTIGDGVHPDDKPDSWIALPRTAHSKKPVEFRQIIRKMYPKGRAVELFARETADGWDAWGNEV